jgi:hypothetical protein
LAGGTVEYREHFLTRVLRLGDEAVDRVMGLWREGDALRAMVAAARGDAGRALERPIAIEVDDGGRSAHVIVALDGALITVLSADMAVTGVDLVVPWDAFEKARERVGVRREADQHKGELRRRFGWRTVWHRIQSGPHPGREAIERALADPEGLRAILPGGLEGLREEYLRRALMHNRSRLMDGEGYRRLLCGRWSLGHAARLAGAAHVTDCGRTLSMLTLEPYHEHGLQGSGQRVAQPVCRSALARAAGSDNRSRRRAGDRNVHVDVHPIEVGVGGLAPRPATRGTKPAPLDRRQPGSTSLELHEPDVEHVRAVPRDSDHHRVDDAGPRRTARRVQEHEVPPVRRRPVAQRDLALPSRAPRSIGRAAPRRPRQQRGLRPLRSHGNTRISSLSSIAAKRRSFVQI